MSKESDKSTPVPTAHEKEHRRNQSTETKRYKPKFNLLIILVFAIIALLIIAAFAGLLKF
ncbi:hypothetical protein [Gillisia limnaea]|uniref:Uncharacterized protein n=1 Tax=Gillisia limnaea (strain DSM 15749 / LMG 21470 / R-8282) TaxID=865937 RepID=H2C020_GILLR|nr:hypothetical protein [Gillisia limnaea]EHQ02387.1 hypothetical protein Gilli_1744 [Gillisia limnaea DSM 15749]